MSNSIIKQIIDGRTDLVFDYLAEGHAATSTDKDGVSLIKWCAYFRDVSGIKFLLANGESIVSFRQQCMIFLEQSCMHCCRKLTAESRKRLVSTRPRFSDCADLFKSLITGSC